MHRVPSMLPQRLWYGRYSRNGEVTAVNQRHHNKWGIFHYVGSHAAICENAPFYRMENFSVLNCAVLIFYACFFRLTYPQGYPQGKQGVTG